MDVRFLIDSITRQTTLLIAQLATAAGLRAPLAHISNQVFLDIARELDKQGVSRKVAADMFGMALRSYHAKVRRLTESETDDQLTLWEAVYNYVAEEERVTHGGVMTRFRYDDDKSVRGILHDLVETGLIVQTGRGDGRVYRLTTDEEFELVHGRDAESRAYWAVWMVIYRDGPFETAELGTRLGLSQARLRTVLKALEGDGHIEHTDAGWDSSDCHIPMEEAAGWEAAVFDHYSAFTTALSRKLMELSIGAESTDVNGGSTYTFDIGPDHPMRDEILGLLSRYRTELSELRERALQAGGEEEHPDRVIFYLGQSVIPGEE